MIKADHENNPSKHFIVHIFSCNKSYFKMAQYNKDGYSENRDHSTVPNITNPSPRVTPKKPQILNI